MNVLGCDLSLRSSGLVLIGPRNKVLYADLVKPKDSMRGMERIVWLMDEYRERMTSWGQMGAEPMDIVIEDLAKGSDNKFSLVALCQGATGFQIVAHNLGYKPNLVSASHCRKWLTGNGHADKQHVADRLKVDYGISFNNDKGYDLSDAALLSMWKIHHR